MISPLLDRVLGLAQLKQVYQATGGSLGRALELLGIRYRFEEGSLDLIPKSGPVLVTANHPTGLLEGLLMAILLPLVRPDVRILANSVLSAIPELRDLCIFADLSSGPAAIAANARALKDCARWLDAGGLLMAFPAGEVAHLGREARWNPALARLARRSEATAVPVHFSGRNSFFFQAAGLLHPVLRTLQLPRELLNKHGATMQIRVGRPVAPATLRAFPDASVAMEHLRRRTELLPKLLPAPATTAMEPIADPIDPSLLAADVALLPLERKLCESGDLSVWLGNSIELPHVLREIGRLREIAFRGAGEGTGHSRDLDRFDQHYQHLFLWNAVTREVAGAYRLAATPDVLPRFGPSGLYTSTLFRYDARFFDQLSGAIELGRSFVRPEYQKQFAPLLLLWKGIGRYVASRPECPILFGAVSISANYREESRAMMVNLLEGQLATELAQWVVPRRRYRAPAAAIPADLEALSRVIADQEPDGKGVPILLKQYMRSGGRVLGFNLDRKFSNALDALMLVDMRHATPGLKARLRESREPAVTYS